MESTIVYSDGTKATAKTKPADFVAFERRYDTGFGDEGVRAEHVFYIVWATLKREGKLEGRVGADDFEAWLPTVDDIDEGELRAGPKAQKGTRRRGASPK